MYGKTTFIRDFLLHPQLLYEALYIYTYQLDQPAFCEIVDTLAVQVTTYTSIPKEPIQFDPSEKKLPHHCLGKVVITTTTP